MFANVFFVFVVLLRIVATNNIYEFSISSPVVVWHGMGDDSTSCSKHMVNFIERYVDGAYVKCLRIGRSSKEDVKSGFFVHPNKQVEEVCEQIKNDTKLENGYNAVGFSQGGQFLRAVAQRCPDPPMKILITFGAQHQGVYGLPHCSSSNFGVCSILRYVLSKAAYLRWVQNSVVQATYWHDPFHEMTYRHWSTFLSDINNEIKINKSYVENLQKLDKFVMVKFLNDTMVQPIESQWFEFYREGQAKLIEPLRESKLYLEDRLGLRKMDENGKLVFLEKEGDHLELDPYWFIEKIVPYLRK